MKIETYAGARFSPEVAGEMRAAIQAADEVAFERVAAAAGGLDAEFFTQLLAKPQGGLETDKSLLEVWGPRSVVLARRALSRGDDPFLLEFAAKQNDEAALRFLRLLCLEPRFFARFLDALEPRLLRVTSGSKKSLLRNALSMMENLDANSFGRDPMASLEGSLELLLERCPEQELRLHLGILGQKPFGESHRASMGWKQRAQRKARERLEYAAAAAAQGRAARDQQRASSGADGAGQGWQRKSSTE